jgi:hypothetical protein
MRTVLQGLHMRVIETSAEIKIAAADIDAEGQLVDARGLLAGHLNVLKQMNAELVTALGPTSGETT